MNLQKLETLQGSFIIATVNAELAIGRESLFKGLSEALKRMFPQQKILFLADWLKLEYLGEKQLRQLGHVVIEQLKRPDGKT